MLKYIKKENQEDLVGLLPREYLIKKEMNEIISWLNQHDYLINKMVLNELDQTDSQWTEYLENRRIKIARYNELERELGELNGTNND